MWVCSELIRKKNSNHIEIFGQIIAGVLRRCIRALAVIMGKFRERTSALRDENENRLGDLR